MEEHGEFAEFFSVDSLFFIGLTPGKIGWKKRKSRVFRRQGNDF